VSLIPDRTGFYTPWDAVADFEKARDPELRSGYINFGLAHGTPGPLALMALAREQGVELPSLADGIQALARHLLGNIQETSSGLDVPYYVPLGSARSNIGLSRTAWCYGNPGVARAVQLAAITLNDGELKTAALRLMQSVANRSPAARKLIGPTFCHGMAGVLQITLRFLQDSPEPEASLLSFAEETLRSILAFFDEARPTGFPDVGPEEGAVNNPGLLEGCAGVAMVLLSLDREIDKAWDSSFLLR
jgi:hypothetical protein